MLSLPLSLQSLHIHALKDILLLQVKPYIYKNRSTAKNDTVSLLVSMVYKRPINSAMWMLILVTHEGVSKNGPKPGSPVVDRLTTTLKDRKIK